MRSRWRRSCSRRPGARRRGSRASRTCSGSARSSSSKAPWRERKEAYVAALGNKPRSVLLVSAADKLFNARAIVADLRTIREKVGRRFNAPKEDVLSYYGALVDAFRANPAYPVALVDEFERVVAEMRQLSGVAG